MPILIWCQQLDFESAAPPEQALRRKLNSHASILKEFSITFTEAIKMVINSYSLSRCLQKEMFDALSL